MLWTNKVWSISRYNGTIYTTNVPQFRFRFNPNKSKPEKTYRMSQDHIEYRLYCNQVEVQSGDKITQVWWSEFTVIGIDPYDDTLGKHLELTIRWRNTDMHKNVHILKKSTIQPDYDPILKEFVWNRSMPSMIDTTIKALIDENQKHKEKWVDQLWEWRYEHINYIMTLEIDQKVEKENMVILPDGETYLIDWIYTLPYQVFYWLKKTFKTNGYIK